MDYQHILDRMREKTREQAEQAMGTEEFYTDHIIPFLEYEVRYWRAMHDEQVRRKRVAQNRKKGTEQ